MKFGHSGDTVVLIGSNEKEYNSINQFSVPVFE